MVSNAYNKAMNNKVTYPKPITKEIYADPKNFGFYPFNELGFGLNVSKDNIMKWSEDFN